MNDIYTPDFTDNGGSTTAQIELAARRRQVRFQAQKSLVQFRAGQVLVGIAQAIAGLAVAAFVFSGAAGQLLTMILTAIK